MKMARMFSLTATEESLTVARAVFSAGFTPAGHVRAIMDVLERVESGLSQDADDI